MTNTLHITYLFDPLCGWCYGAAPLMARLAEAPGLKVTPVPTGLFSGAGARPVDAGFAAFAWSHDQRIASLSGQIFSETYRNDVLAKGGMLDSGPATLALTAVALTAPERELEALKSIQEARYVAGLDVTAIPVLVKLLEELGLDAAADRLVSPDADLVAHRDRRHATARDLMRAFAVQGVPGVVVDNGRNKTLLRSQDLFGNPELIARLVAAAANPAP